MTTSLVCDKYGGKLFMSDGEKLVRVPMTLQKGEDELAAALQRIHEDYTNSEPIELQLNNLGKLISKLGGTIGHSKVATYDFGNGLIYNADSFHKGSLPNSIVFRPFSSSVFSKGDKVDIFVFSRDEKFVTGIQVLIK